MTMRTGTNIIITTIMTTMRTNTSIIITIITRTARNATTPTASAIITTTTIIITDTTMRTMCSQAGVPRLPRTLPKALWRTASTN